MIRRYSVFIFIFLLACVDPFSTQTEKESDRIVVEGEITDQAPPYNIRLTTTSNYSQTLDGIIHYVSGAQISVCDDDGACIPFFEVDKGRYQTAVNAARGKIGKSYHVEILTAEGKHIFSKPETMIPSPPVTKVYFEYDLSTLSSEGFHVYIDTDDPADARNYYKWETIGYDPYSQYCFNKISDKPLELIASDERANGKAISRLQVRRVPYNTTAFYVLEVYQLALSPGAYAYLNSVKKQIQSTGSIFDPPPSFIRGNLYNTEDESENVLGYFVAAGTSRKDLVIDRTSTVVGAYPRPFVSPVAEPQYCGDPCNLLCVAWTGGKCGNRPCPPDCAFLPNVTNIAPDAWPLPHHPCGP
jgi:Domain of unknown function (DUF4249)